MHLAVDQKTYSNGVVTNHRPQTKELRHFLKLSDWTNEELVELIQLGLQLKRDNFRSPVAEDKVLGLLFNNPSLRTRMSFEVAASHIGAKITSIQPGNGSWNIETNDGVVMDGNAQEHLREMVAVVTSYVDALGVRHFASLSDEEADTQDSLIHKIAEISKVPVINLESAQSHPCQSMADWMTLHEVYGDDLSHVNVVVRWAPHPKPLPRAVPNSALEAFVRSGANVTLACPEEMTPGEKTLNQLRQYSDKFQVSHSKSDGLKGANVVYAKSWHGSMIYSDPKEEERVRKGYSDWTVTESDMKLTDNGHFMHCLPVRRNVVVSDQVLDSKSAIHIQEAENRLHIQKALLMKLWNLS
ncbi:MAG TPA: N-acetylornithine carbamoyltransferase [Balneolales bacterium]|nr:N-acetylornithine carbamoyltransferase [Balneolales bacterium]